MADERSKVTGWDEVGGEKDWLYERDMRGSKQREKTRRQSKQRHLPRQEVFLEQTRKDTYRQILYQAANI